MFAVASRLTHNITADRWLLMLALLLLPYLLTLVGMVLTVAVGLKMVGAVGKAMS